MKVPLCLKRLMWPPWAERELRDIGWDQNHRVLAYLLGCIDGAYDCGVAQDYIDAARIVNERMRELA